MCGWVSLVVVAVGACLVFGVAAGGPPDGLYFAVCIEALDDAILGVGYIDPALGVLSKAAGPLELAGPGSLSTKLLHDRVEGRVDAKHLVIADVSHQHVTI